MKAKDLKFKQLVKTDAASGTLLLADNRAVLIEVDALGRLRKELIDNLGTDIAKGILLRYGYRCGRADAMSLRDRYGWNSEMEWLLAGPRMHALEGIVKVEIEEIKMDRSSGQFFARGQWKNSFEADQHLKLFGPAQTPVCWSLVGYASGYASAFMGREVFCMETECLGRGDAVCRFELKGVEEGGEAAEDYQRYFDRAQFKLRFDDCLHCIGNLSSQLVVMTEPRGYLENIVRNSPEAIITTDENRVIRFYSQGAEALSGYAAEEMIGRNASELYAAHLNPIVGRREPLEERGRRHYETTFLARNGSPIPVHAAISLIEDRLGKGIGWLHIVRDWREAHRLTSELKERDAFLANILLDSADAIITLDAQDNITSWNRGAEITYGYEEQEMIGRPLAVIVPPELLKSEELAKLSRQLRRDGIIRNYQTERITKDGRRITILVTRTVIRNERGEIIGSSAVVKDITKVKGMERQLMRAEHFAVLGELAASLAHEIKNPLGGIKGAIEVLCDDLSDGNSHKATLKEMLFEVDRIDKAVRDLLSYAKPKGPEFGEVDLEPLLRRVVSLAEKHCKGRRIKIELSLNHALDPLWGDAHQLEQLFLNLVINSIQAMDQAGLVKISVAGHQERGVEILIQDTGRGISREIKDSVFQPFFTTKTEGTGLGLTICQRIVMDHGGFLDLKSDPGSGTTAHVWLPWLPQSGIEEMAKEYR